MKFRMSLKFISKNMQKIKTFSKKNIIFKYWRMFESYVFVDFRIRFEKNHQFFSKNIAQSQKMQNIDNFFN